MATFDQRNQRVTYQYNAAGDINIGAARNREELAGELKKLRTELDRAAAEGAVELDAATEAGDQLDKAVRQAEKPAPNVQPSSGRPRRTALVSTYLTPYTALAPGSAYSPTARSRRALARQLRHP